MSKRYTFWIYIFIVSVLILLVGICFSSPSSEARVSSHDPGFFENNNAGCTSGLSDVSHKHGFTGSNPVPANVGLTSRGTSAVSTHSKVKETAIDSTDNPERGEYIGPCSPHSLKETAIYRVTAYCPCDRCCGKWSDGVTASGHIIVKEDAFVAAPSSFAFGTMLDIPGYGKVPVLDRGEVIKGKRLDVFFNDHETALRWGVKHLKIEVEK